MKKNPTVSEPEPGQKEYRLFWRGLKVEADDEVEQLFSLAFPLIEKLTNACAAVISVSDFKGKSPHLLQMGICVLELDLAIWRWARPLNLGPDSWRDNGIRFLSQTHLELRAEFQKRFPSPAMSFRPARFSADVVRSMTFDMIKRQFPEMEKSGLYETMFWEGLFHDHIFIKVPTDGEMTEREGVQAMRDEFERQVRRHAQSIKWKSEPTWPDKRDDTDHYNWLARFQCRQKETITGIAESMGHGRYSTVRVGIHEAADSIGLTLREMARGGRRVGSKSGHTLPRSKTEKR